MFVLTISRPSMDRGHLGSKTMSLGEILGNYCLHSGGHICDFYETWSECLFRQYLGAVWIWVKSGKKLGHHVKS